MPTDAHDEPTRSIQLEPIRDAATLDAALDQYPRLRERPDFADLRADCDTYFQALAQQDALNRGETTIPAIAEAVGTYPEQVRRWLTGDRQPRLLWLLDFDRTTASARSDLDVSETAPATPTDAILRATRDPTYREHLLQPHTFTPEAVDRLLAFRTTSDTAKSLDPTAFTHITDRTTYEQALRAFPLIQEHPRFDTLQRQAQLYFQLRDHPPQRSDGRLPTTALTDYASIAKSTLHTWVTDKQRPHLLTLLEERAATLKDYQDRVATLRDLDGGISTIHDLAHRLNPTHFMFGDQVTSDPKCGEQLNTASQYLATLQLVEAGYHPRDLEIHFHLNKDALCDRLRYEHRPDLVRLAANIPDTQPDPERRWLPTTTDASKLPARYVQAPPEVTSHRDFLPLLEALPSLSNPDHHLIQQLKQFGPGPEALEKWSEEFGPLTKTEDKLRAFAYLIGTTLSDGTITRESAYGSLYGMSLSTKYDWSRAFGNRAAYYLTSLGIPTKQGPDVPPRPGQEYGNHQWWSVSSPMLTWFNEAVLGFQPGETHSHTPAQIRWVLDAPRAFQIGVLQGLFDGDGWASVSKTEIGVSSTPNIGFIRQLLERVGIEATENKSDELVIRSYDGVHAAVDLPIFLSAAGRQKNAEEVAKMLECTVPSTKHIEDASLVGEVQRIGQNPGRSLNEIRLEVYRQLGVTLRPETVGRIIEGGERRLQINQSRVQSYFRLLELRQENPSATAWQLARRVQEESGTTTSLSTLRNWLNGDVPKDVKRALSSGQSLDQAIIDSNPHLQQYLPKPKSKSHESRT